MHRIYFRNRCLRLRSEWAYRLVRSFFREVDAAGGLVSDGTGRCLMILRNGIWDLPKGHREKGEDIKTTALREVMEETGVTDLSLGGLICVTDHTYRRDGKWHLKHTWWYDMRSSGAGQTSPQGEEGIEKAVWLNADEVSACMENTYPSIREVFDSRRA